MSTDLIKKSKVIYASQDEYEMIVEENENEFEMSAKEAREDALLQLTTSNKDVSRICKTKEEQQLVDKVNRYLTTKEDVFQHFEEIFQLFESFDFHLPSYLSYSMIKNGFIGMLLYYITKDDDALIVEGFDRKMKLLKLTESLCEHSVFAREVLPPEGLTRLLEMMNKYLVSSLENDLSFIEQCFQTIIVMMKNMEINKKLFYERNLNHTLQLYMSDHNHRHTSIQLLCTVIQSYLQDDDFNFGTNAIEFDGFTRARKLGEETHCIAYLGSHFHDGKNDVEMISLTIRLVCVTDILCKKALDCSILNKAIETIVQTNKGSTSLFILVRHLCMNDEAKQKVGLNKQFGVVALQTIEQSLSGDDEPLLSASLSCLGVVFLRQPRCCDVFGHELDTIDVLLTCLKQSSSLSNLTIRYALIALRNLYSNPLNDPLKEKAIKAGAEQVLRGMRIEENPKRKELRTFVEDCLRDLGLPNYRV
jgi:hypothetical protein